MSALTMAITESQKALALAVGWMGWRVRLLVSALVGSDTYRPFVEYCTVLAPRELLTRMVSFA